jgi:type I restriction enzyme S subunit
MMQDNRVALVDVCESLRYGYTASASHEEVGPKFLRITDIVPDAIDWDSVPFCEIDDADRNRFSLQPDDIVVARTGATVGYAKLIRDEVDAVFASYLVRFRVDPKLADPGFVGRLVESLVYKDFVKSRVGGAAQPNANAQVLGSFTFRLPTRREQERISSILSAYDDLIENNRRRMALLEEAARQLYREWFVRLRFPGHEHTHITHGVPEGWEFKPIGEVATLNYGKALKEDNRLEGTTPVYGSSGVVGSHSTALVSGPGIVVGRKGNVGSVFWSDTPFWPIDTVYFVSPEESSLFLYHCLRQVPFQSSDVAVPGLNRTYAHSLKILMPSRRLQAEFEEAITPMFEQLTRLRTMNQKLRVARDLLLPRLMSGEIAV